MKTIHDKGDWSSDAIIELANKLYSVKPKPNNRNNNVIVKEVMDPKQFVVVLDGVLADEESKFLLNRSESMGYEDAPTCK